MKRRTFIAPRAASLDDTVAAELSLTKAQARALVEVGAVYVGGKRVRDPARSVAAQATVTAVLSEAGQGATTERPAPPPLVVLFEDDRVLVVDKPAGVAAQPTPSGGEVSLLELASAHLGREAGLVHRLDRETSGVTLFGKTSEATSALAAAFRDGVARKRYLAVTGPGLPESGRIDLPLSRDPARPGRWRASRAANGIDAVTDYHRLWSGAQCGVALFPATGRTHQLRAHLAGIGAPIVGDGLYGGSSSSARCLLHAQALDIEGVVYEAPLPPDMRECFEAANVAPPAGRWSATPRG